MFYLRAQYAVLESGSSLCHKRHWRKHPLIKVLFLVVVFLSFVKTKHGAAAIELCHKVGNICCFPETKNTRKTIPKGCEQLNICQLIFEKYNYLFIRETKLYTSVCIYMYVCVIRGSLMSVWCDCFVVLHKPKSMMCLQTQVLKENLLQWKTTVEGKWTC